MDKLVETYAIETIKQQCNALQSRGIDTSVTLTKFGQETNARVKVQEGRKTYHFADPDLNVIISQLCAFSQKRGRRER